MFNKLFCFIMGHDLTVDAGSCPFTGKTYKMCLRCGSLGAV